MKLSCPHCGQHYDISDSDIGKESDCISCGKRFVLHAGMAVSGQEQTSTAPHCPYCGGEIQSGVKKCRHCGEWLNRNFSATNKLYYLLFALFFGMIGIHNFIFGQKKAGFEKIIMLLTGWRIIAIFAHPLGFFILAAEILWIIVEVVLNFNQKTLEMSPKKAVLGLIASVLVLIASYVYGEYYKLEVDAVRASYSLAFCKNGGVTQEQAEKRMEQVMDLPFANVREVSNAARQGMRDGANWSLE